MSDKKKELMQQLNSETSKIAWSEMQKFFASGAVVRVDGSLDLIDSAAEIALDNKSQLQSWMDDDLVSPVSDEEAQQWLEEDSMVWAVVIAPYVFVQTVDSRK